MGELLSVSKPRYQARSKSRKGQALVSQRNNQPWHGFTLQRGHFFGEFLRPYSWYYTTFDAHGKRVTTLVKSRYFVCALKGGGVDLKILDDGRLARYEVDDKLINIYLLDESSGDYVWRSHRVHASDKILEPIFKAVEYRNSLGIKGVEFPPLEKQHCAAPNRLTTPAYNYKGRASNKTGTIPHRPEWYYTANID